LQRCEHTVGHAEAKTRIAELQAMQPGDDLYDAKFKVLGENILEGRARDWRMRPLYPRHVLCGIEQSAIVEATNIAAQFEAPAMYGNAQTAALGTGIVRASAETARPLN